MKRCITILAHIFYLIAHSIEIEVHGLRSLRMVFRFRGLGATAWLAKFNGVEIKRHPGRKAPSCALWLPGAIVTQDRFSEDTAPPRSPEEQGHVG
jgi:hypothetical protein